MPILLLCAVFAGGFFVGKKNAPEKIVEQTRYRHLTEWEMLEMAIAKTESEFRQDAVGNAGDIGIFQITPIYVAEVNRILGNKEYYHTDAFDTEKSVRMFSVVQDRRNPDRDVERAIALHNPKGDSIGYTCKVLDNLRYVSRMEDVRAAICGE